MFCIMDYRRDICTLAFVLIVHLSIIPVARLSCPTGCSCQDQTVICNGVSSFPNLTFTSSNFSAFQFSNCRFAYDTLPMIPQSYMNITTLSFTNCAKAVASDAFASLVKLHSLTITKSNSLKFQSFAPFDTLELLQILDLSDNELTTLPADLCGGDKPLLRIVNISHNRLQKIPLSTFRRCSKSLEQIEMQNNNFSTLSLETLPWFYLYSLNMSSNPWNCDCAMQWVKDIPKVLFTGSRCSLPEKYNGKELYDAENEMLCGLGNKSIALGIGIPGLIVCVLVLGYCLYKIIHRNRKRMHSSSVKYNSVYGDTVESSYRRSNV